MRADIAKRFFVVTGVFVWPARPGADLAQLSQLLAIWAFLQKIFACKFLFYRHAGHVEGLRGV